MYLARISDNKDRIGVWSGIVSYLRLSPLVFLQCACLLNAGLEHSRSDLVFEQSRLPTNFIIGMLYSISCSHDVPDDYYILIEIWNEFFDLIG